MKQCEAGSSKMEIFITELKNTGDFNATFTAFETPQEARNFFDFTFKVMDSIKDYLQAAIFTFGREYLNPGMFISIVNDIKKNFTDSISVFKFYPEKHIVVDADHHSHLTLLMTSHLCSSDEHLRKEAELSTIQSMQKRIDL